MLAFLWHFLNCKNALPGVPLCLTLPHPRSIITLREICNLMGEERHGTRKRI